MNLYSHVLPAMQKEIANSMELAARLRAAIKAGDPSSSDGLRARLAPPEARLNPIDLMRQLREE